MQTLPCTKRVGCGTRTLTSSAPTTWRASRRPPCCPAVQASKQQQQQQQQQPVSSFKGLMQAYKSIAPATAGAPASEAGPAKSSSSGGSSPSRDAKGAPRLKPSRQTSAPPDASGNKRGAKAAAAGGDAAAKAQPKASRPSGFAPAGRSASKKTQGNSRATRDSSSEPQSSSTSSDGRQSSSSSSSSSSDGRQSSRSISSSKQQQLAIPGGWLLPSNGKGFGTPAAPAAAAAAAPAGGDAPSRRRRQGEVRVFRFGVEAAAVTKAAEACGWSSRVLLVDSIKEADIILAAKCSSGGKHRNLAQGQKAANNAGIPFVVVGRKLSVEGFRQALVPHVAPDSKEAAALAAAAADEAARMAANKATADAFFRTASGWGSGSRRVAR